MAYLGRGKDHNYLLDKRFQLMLKYSINIFKYNLVTAMANSRISNSYNKRKEIVMDSQLHNIRIAILHFSNCKWEQIQ